MYLQNFSTNFKFSLLPLFSYLQAFPTKTQYGTMPRQTGSQVLQQLHTRLQEHEMDQKKNQTLPSNKSEIQTEENALNSSKNRSASSASNHKSTGVSFGKGFFKLRYGKRSSSESRLGDGFLM